MKYIPLTRPSLDHAEEQAILNILRSGHLEGNQQSSKRVESQLRNMFLISHALLTTSCTHALELALLILDLQPSDEVILPSFTFTSTANAIVLRGAKPVFVDIDPHTWNLDANLIEAAITPQTKGIVPVHYAGQGCDMASITELAQHYGLWVVEDAAQAVGASYQNKPLGTWGTIGCLSFHNTKNIVSGEGGALLTADDKLAKRAEIISEKGTNRSAFLRGEVDKYTWVDVGSSYIVSDLLAALLEVQLSKVSAITEARKTLWHEYQHAFQELADQEYIQLPYIHPDAQSNWHLYGFLVDPNKRHEIITFLRNRGLGATFHYVPLHTAPAAARFGEPSHLPITDHVSTSLIRLPLYPDLNIEEQHYIIEQVFAAFEQ